MKDQDVNRKFRELELKAEFLEQSKTECEQQIEDLRNERKDLNEQCLNLTTKNAELVKVRPGNGSSAITYSRAPHKQVTFMLHSEVW